MTEVLERPPVVDTEELSKTPHERRFGNQEIVHLPLHSLLMVSQIRGCENPAHNDLKESIDQEDLDNPINIARVDEDGLSKYLEFTNRTWGSSLSVADVEEYRQPDGLFNLVVGGHSRTISIQELAAEHTGLTGQPTTWEVQCKLLKNTSVFGIVSKQLSENIHKGAPIEREAMAIVEIYSIGLGTEWNDVKSFQKAMKGKLKKSTINAAVNFHSLPEPIRKQVYRKELPYEAGVALGKSVDTYSEYVARKAGYDPDTDTIDEEGVALIQQIVSDKLTYLAGYMTNRKMSSSQSRLTMRSHTKTWQGRIELMKAEAAGKEAEELQEMQDALFGDIDMIDPKVELRNELRRQKAKNERLFKEMAEAPMQRATELLIGLGDPGSQVVKAIIEDAGKAAQRVEAFAAKKAGQVALLPIGGVELTEGQQLAV